MNQAGYLTYPRTYINLILVLVGMVVLFPIGIGGFVAAVVVAVVLAALLASLLGAVLLNIELFIANVVVSILRRYVSVRIAGFRFGQDA